MNEARNPAGNCWDFTGDEAVTNQAKIAADALALIDELQKSYDGHSAFPNSDWLTYDNLSTIIAALELLKPMQERIEFLEKELAFRTARTNPSPTEEKLWVTDTSHVSTLLDKTRIDALEEAADIAGHHLRQWGCANGFEGHTAAARIIRDEIRALKSKSPPAGEKP